MRLVNVPIASTSTKLSCKNTYPNATISKECFSNNFNFIYSTEIKFIRILFRQVFPLVAETLPVHQIHLLLQAHSQMCSQLPSQLGVALWGHSGQSNVGRSDCTSRPAPPLHPQLCQLDAENSEIFWRKETYFERSVGPE